MKSLIIVFASTVILSMFVTCDGLYCYVCNSLDHTACEDEFDEKRAMAAGFNTSCPEPEEPGFRALCRKTHQTVLEEVRIIRSCGFANSSRDCEGSRNKEVIVTSCQCFEDNCNSAGLPEMAPAALLLAAALRVIY